jgi:hypothetical protein
MRAMTNSSRVTSGQGAGSSGGCVDSEGARLQRESADSEGVRLQRESAGSEGESIVQRESTFRSRWERGIFQDCQEGVMG